MTFGRRLGVAVWLCAAVLAEAAPDSARLNALLAQHREHPSDWKLCNEIAGAYVTDQQFERAAEYYRKVTALNPAFLPARKNLAVVLWFAGRKSEAEPLFRRLVREIPNDPVPHLYLGLASYEREQYTEAARQFSSAGDLAMRNPEVLPAVVDSLLASKDTSVVSPALAYLQESADPQLAVRLATVFNRRGEYSATIRALAGVETDSDAQLLLAEAYDHQKDPQHAYAAFNRAIQGNPRSERAYAGLALFASDHRNNSFALEILNRGLQNVPGSPMLLLQKGILLAIEGDRENAERTLQNAAAAKPSWPLPLLAIGILQLEAARLDEAESTFQRTCAAFPREEAAHFFYGLTLTRKGDDASRTSAIAALERALTLTPDDTRARILLGQTYVAAGRLEDGVRELRRGVHADAGNASALYQLSLAYRKLGRTALAQKYLDAFRAVKSKTESEPSDLVSILKVLK